MPCSKCKADFNLLNWKLKCQECEGSFCFKCLTKQEGSYFCYTCTILIQRPPIRTSLMELKSKDLQQYLNKHHVPTHGLVEKHELIDLFWRYHIPVEYKKTNRNKLLNFTGSVPNLAAKSQCYLNNLKTNAEAALNQTRNFWPQEVFSATTSPTRNHRTPSTHAYDFSNASAFEEGSTHVNHPQFETPQSNVNDESELQPSKKYPNLSDFKTEEDLNELSVKQLKELLALNRVNYKGCIEKAELLQKAVQLWKNVQEDNSSDVGTNYDNCCKICMDAPMDCVLLECGHIATCIQCGKQLAECPICRQYITRVVRTFKV